MHPTSGQRVGLLVCSPSASSEALDTIARTFGWTPADELSHAYRIPLGPASEFAGVTELNRFLQGRMPLGVEGLRFSWLEAQGDLVRLEPLRNTPPTELGSAELWELLRGDRLESWVQPIIDARTGDVWGHEYLIRAYRSDGSPIHPDDLFSAARRENMTPTLDHACRAIHIAKAAKAATSDARILINVVPSAIDSVHASLWDTSRTVFAAGLDPSRIIFEITESESVPDVTLVRKTLEQLRLLGFTFALDDLGMGDAGLRLLGDLRPDLIKIDKAVLTNSFESDLHLEIFRSLVAIGLRSGRRVIAEGIETQEQLSRAREMGVPLLQGFLFGEPSPEY